MKVVETFVQLVKGIDNSYRKIPLIEIDSEKEGPVIWLTAAIHGDEVTGTAIVQSIVKKLLKYPLKSGKIFAFPIMNPTGFETISRKEQYDEADLNRYFDGEPDGSPAERHAVLILNTILKTNPDYVIDLHFGISQINRTSEEFKITLGCRHRKKCRLSP